MDASPRARHQVVAGLKEDCAWRTLLPEHNSKRKVVITEATSGLEEASTQEFAGAGGLEAISARCEQLLEELERQWESAGVQCLDVPVRAGTQRHMGKLSPAAVSRLLGVFVNQAEGGAVGRFLDVSFQNNGDNGSKRLAKALGWLSVGLGAAEIFARGG